MIEAKLWSLSGCLILVIGALLGARDGSRLPPKERNKHLELGYIPRVTRTLAPRSKIVLSAISAVWIVCFAARIAWLIHVVQAGI